MTKFKQSNILPTPFGLETWYIIETESQLYQVTCRDIEAVEEAVRVAKRLNIQIHELRVSEYGYEKRCEDNRALIDSCNAEVFIGG